MADPKKPEVKEAPKPSIEEALKILFANFSADDVRAAVAATATARPPLPAEYKGARTYRLTERHYRQGTMYEAGQLITVTNEWPGKSWVPYAGETPVVPDIAALPPAGARASDKDI